MATSFSTSPEKEAEPHQTPTKRSGFAAIRAALFGSHRRSATKKDVIEKPNAAAGSGPLWKNLICGIRPLHSGQFEDDLPPPQRSSPPPPPPFDAFHDVAVAPPSPVNGISSRYASADDLQALETNYEEGDGSPNAIDLEAEEFIARFYEQMKLQRNESVADRC